MVSRLFHWMKHYACNGFYEVCSKQTCLCRTLGGKVITTMMKKYTRELRPQKTEKEERKGSVEILQNSICHWVVETWAIIPYILCNFL